jgi:translation initiation factor 3 subunit L
MAAQQESRKLRSYMKLYTSIETQKLAAFHDQSEETFTSLLISYRTSDASRRSGREIQEALDIHYHLNGNMVNVDEAEKQRRFEDYFMKQIASEHGNPQGCRAYFDCNLVRHCYRVMM